MKNYMFILLLLSPYLYSEIRVKEVTISGIENSINHQVAEKILLNSYKKIGVKVNFITFPAKRAIANSNSGILDGEAQRVIEIEATYPNLVRVPIPLFSSDTFVYSKKLNFRATNWDAFLSYRVGLLAGIKHQELITRNYNRIFVSSPKILINMLIKDRLDFIILDEYIYKKHTIKGTPKGINEIKKVENIIYTTTLYHYLHKKNLSLVSPLSTVLKEMKKNGEIDKIMEYFFLNYQK